MNRGVNERKTALAGFGFHIKFNMLNSYKRVYKLPPALPKLIHTHKCKFPCAKMLKTRNYSQSKNLNFAQTQIQ